MTAIELVRLQIADEGTTPQFDDTRITAFLEMGGNDVNRASSLALRAWAAAMATHETKVITGKWEGNYGDISARMLALAEVYWQTASKMNPGFRHVVIQER